MYEIKKIIIIINLLIRNLISSFIFFGKGKWQLTYDQNIAKQGHRTRSVSFATSNISFAKPYLRPIQVTFAYMTSDLIYRFQLLATCAHVEYALVAELGYSARKHFHFIEVLLAFVLFATMLDKLLPQAHLYAAMRMHAGVDDTKILFE